MSNAKTLLAPHAAVLVVMKGLRSDSWDSFVANKYLCDAISMMKLAPPHVTEVKNELANIADGHRNQGGEHAKNMVDDINSTIEQVIKNHAKSGNDVGVEQADQPVRASPAVEDQRPDPLAR